MRLNPSKYSFGVHARKLLGFVITRRGVEENPDKCHTDIDMRNLSNVKKVQEINRNLDTLSRFLPFMIEKEFHFFTTQKRKDKFKWKNECEEVFARLKVFLATTPILTHLKAGTHTYIYIYQLLIGR